MNTCVLCNKEASSAISLSNGKKLHQKCVDMIVNEQNKYDKLLKEQQSYLYQLRSQLNFKNTLECPL